MSTQRVPVNGVTLNAELREPEDPNGLTLLLLHGFTGSAAGWGAHLDAFAASGLRVIALDMLGHGGSDAPADPTRYRFEHVRGDVLAALCALDVEPRDTVLLGYSMGGRMALHAALGASFRGLILESASPGLATEEERAARRISDEALAARIERDGIAPFVDEWERLPLFASQSLLPDETRDALRQERLRNTPFGLANSLRGAGTGAQPPLHDALPTLTTPTLLLAGEHDEKFSRIAWQIAEHLPNAEARIVLDAGHTVHLEQPDLFDALVTEFCTGLLQIGSDIRQLPS
jgi:2-succinyl-6-hydroxy-2,4-cyclohexadiene-1-carboxylate synthase